jgi:tetratricopeptide (TPR) repeat protein
MPENPRIEELRRRVLADPASIAFAALAEEFRRVGRYEEAIEACRTGLQRHPAYLSARVTLGRALIETGDFEAAQEELQTVLRSAPENLAAIRGLAQIHERQGQSTEMDPGLAALQAEPIPVAAPQQMEPPPAPDLSFETRREPVPEISFDLPGEPAPTEKIPSLAISLDPAPPISMDPIPAAAGEEPPVHRRIDPFASFVPPAPVAAAPPPAAEPAPPLTPIPIRMPECLPIPVVSHPAQAPEAALEAAHESDLELEIEPHVDHIEAAGPDPQVVATLARLEQFLAAIQLARHA